MATFILRWNPELSPFKDADLRRLTDHYPFVTLSWNVWDYTKAVPGDTFFMIRVGGGGHGIMMSGTLASFPKRDDDWSGDGRQTFSCALDVSYAANTATMPYLPLAELKSSIQGFDWEHCHNGALLDDDMADRLRALWRELHLRHDAEFGYFEQRKEWGIDPRAEVAIENFDVYTDEVTLYGIEDSHSMSYANNCVNLDFHIDYQNHVARLLVWFERDFILCITCTGLRKITTDLSDCAKHTSWFRISAEYDPVLHLQSNGIEIYCEHIRFDPGPENRAPAVPVSI